MQPQKLPVRVIRPLRKGEAGSTRDRYRFWVVWCCPDHELGHRAARRLQLHCQRHRAGGISLTPQCG